MFSENGLGLMNIVIAGLNPAESINIYVICLIIVYDEAVECFDDDCIFRWKGLGRKMSWPNMK